MNPAVKRMAYWFWRNSHTTEALDDIQSEAMLAALQCKPELEVVAARRAIIDYLRKVNHTRSTGRQ